MDFRNIEYIPGTHVVERLKDRVSDTLDETKAKILAQLLCEKGELLLITDNVRYIRNEGFTFPCIKTYTDNRKYVIKTLLTKDMAVKPE